MANTITSKIELNVELDENRVPEKLIGLRMMVV